MSAVQPDGRRLVVLAGPTAVGKGTVCQWVQDNHPEVWVSVSATTRAPRPGEVDGRTYHFVSPERFGELVDTGQMLEHAVVHGVNSYGTPRGPVLDALSQGRPALLEIDLQGARQVREAMPEALFVFLAPPSWDELVRRLVGRGTEDAEERARRLQTAERELAAADWFDTIIVNESVEAAGRDLVDLLLDPPPVPADRAARP